MDWLTITWTAPGGVNTCTLSASGTHDTNAICTDAGAPSGVGLVRSDADCQIFEMRDARVVIENGSAWEEKVTDGNDNVTWLFHSFNGNDSAVEFQGATSRFDWGNKIGTDINAPVTSKGHGYWFQTYNKTANFHWSRYH